MNDDQVMTAVRDSFARVRLDVPLEQTIRRGRALRGRSRRYQLAGVAGVAAVAGVTAVAVTGLGRATAPPTASSHPTAIQGGPGASAGANTGGATLDAWTVTKNPNGIVDVTIRQLADAAGLQRALRADGVPARVTFLTGVPSDTPPLPAGCTMVAMSDEADAKLQSKILGMVPMDPRKGIALTLDSRQIPSGVGVYLAVQPQGPQQNGGMGWGWGLDLVKTAPGCTG